MDSGNCGIFHAGFLSLSLSRKRASEQASCEERFLLFFTAYKQAMGRSELWKREWRHRL